MSDIQGLSLTELDKLRTEYRDLAKQLTSHVTNIYNEIVNLRTYWTGNNANTVINKWNSDCDTLKNNILYFGYHIYHILSDIFTQYNSMENGKVEDRDYRKDPSMGFPEADEIKKIELTDASNITFDQAKANTASNNITGYVTNVNSTLKQIVEKPDFLGSYSDSLKTFATIYRDTASTVQTTLMNICNAIRDEFDKEKNNVINTENLNEEDAKRAGAVSSQGGEPTAQ